MSTKKDSISEVVVEERSKIEDLVIDSVKEMNNDCDIDKHKKILRITPEKRSSKISPKYGIPGRDPCPDMERKYGPAC